MSYTKLFGSILLSTVWELDSEARIVWITMLALCDRDGIVSASVPGLARQAAVSREATERALAAFLAPDPDSRTPEHEGRRIVPVDGGWRLLNHAKYRDMDTAERRREADAKRQAEKRERDRLRNSPALPNNSPPSAPPASSVTGRDMGVTGCDDRDTSHGIHKVTPSDADASQMQIISEKTNTGARDGTPSPNPLAMEPWAPEGVATVQMSGLRVPSSEELPVVWARFAAYHRKNHQPIDRDAWVYWLTNHHVRQSTGRKSSVDAAPEAFAAREAYELGLRQGLARHSAIVWGPGDDHVLEAAWTAHGRRKDGQPLDTSKRLQWFQNAAIDFGEWLRGHPADAKFYGDGAPAHFGRWLNRAASEEEIRRVGS